MSDEFPIGFEENAVLETSREVMEFLKAVDGISLVDSASKVGDVYVFATMAPCDAKKLEANGWEVYIHTTIPAYPNGALAYQMRRAIKDIPQND